MLSRVLLNPKLYKGEDLSQSVRICSLARMFENNGVSIFYDNLYWKCPKPQREEFLKLISPVYAGTTTRYSCFFEPENLFITVSFQDGEEVADVHFYGDSSAFEEVIERISTKFQRHITPTVQWHYTSSNGIDYKRLTIDVPKTYSSFYPWLGMPMEDFFDSYINSKANVLILIGPPGTGKTSFIKNMIAHKNSGAFVTYEEQVMQKDEFFADFIDSQTQFLIAEDADTYLSARSEGNKLMHKFLNVSDGLVSSLNKKIVFTTNLPSIQAVDEALLRKGRCYKVLTFRPLTREEAAKACDDIGIALPPGNEFLLTDLFNQAANIDEPIKKIGFHV